MYRKYHIPPPVLSSLILSPPTSGHLLTWPVWYSCPSLLKYMLVVQWGFCLGILPVNILGLSLSNCSSSLFSPSPVLFNSFQCVSLCLVSTQCDVFHYYSLSIILFFFSSSQPSLTVLLLQTCRIYLHVCMLILVFVLALSSLKPNLFGYSEGKERSALSHETSWAWWYMSLIPAFIPCL
jgi:hypothetical protein